MTILFAAREDACRNAWLLLASLLLAPCRPQAPPSPSPPTDTGAEAPNKLGTKVDALADEWLQDLRAYRIGVDSLDNLWAWNHSDGSVALFSQDGLQLVSLNVPDAVGLDADLRFGVATLVNGGSTLQATSWDSQAILQVELENPAKSVAWIDEKTAATAPAFAAHRVELWDFEQAKLVGRFGQEQPITPTPGATFARAVVLEYLPGKKVLYTLDSYAGDFRAFSLSGEMLATAALDNPRLAEFETWRMRLDDKAREGGEIHTPALWYFRLAVDEDGNAWTVQDCDDETGTASLMRIADDGRVKSFEMETPCCSRSLAIWNDRLILHTIPGSPGEMCNTIRRLP